MQLDPNRTTHETYIEKIDALLVNIFNLSEEKSRKICEKIDPLPKDKQLAVLELITKKIKARKEEQEAVIEKLENAKKEAIQKIEINEYKQADEQLEKELKNI